MELTRIYQPQPLISPYVLYYWVLETDGYMPIHERTCPFGNVQLIFHREKSIFSSTHNEMQPLSFVSGMNNCYNDLSGVGKVKMLSVAFRPEGARAFLNIPLNLFHNGNISVNDLEDKPLKDLGNVLCTEPDDMKSIQLLEEFFLKRLVSFDHYNHRRIAPAIRALNDMVNLNIADLPSMACLSHKQFNRIFTEYVGSTPKEFQRIIRFQRALFILQNNPAMSLTQLAYDAGYYDQPHLIKDFKQFSGYTPGEFLSLCAPHSDYFTYQ